MNEKPNIPEEIDKTSKSGAHLFWLLFLADVPASYLVHHYKDWPMIAKLLISLLPFLVAAFYIRALVRWIRGMDEMHRQLTVSAFAFAMVIYMGMSGLWSLMTRDGIMEQMFHWWSRLGPVDRTPFTDLWFMAAMIYILFKIIYTQIFNRRFN